MDFAQSLAYLQSLVLLGVKRGLDHTRTLAEALGSPHLAVPCVLVGGTNGKGSTSAFLATALQRAGYGVGLYTSPHLVDVRERVTIGGELISQADFARAMSQVREVAEASAESGEAEGPPTYFEALTLLAMEHFKSRKVEVAVLEVGMGGRLDCTNIADPRVTVVTNVGMDHQEFLGDRIEAIAREKAGIFRPGVPAFTAARVPEALAVLHEEARSVGAPLHDGRGVEIRPSGSGWRLSCPEGAMDLPHPALAGAHQIQNAALAVRCAWALRGLGLTLPDEAIRAGVREAAWPGRLERAGAAPDLILDGAHNPDGCQALAEFVGSLPTSPRGLVFTAMRDKDVSAMASLLFPRFDAVWATTVPMARCCTPEEVLQRSGMGNVRTQADAARALQEARQWVGPEGLVVAAGSLYLVGHIKTLLDNGFFAGWAPGL